jgi:hypothetical protein
MATMLITEALQQVKILTDRIQKKHANVKKYITHNSRFIDPLAKEGGSSKYIASEIQATSDLQKNLVALRVAIQKKNLESVLTLQDRSLTIAEWLIWRREVAPAAQTFTSTLALEILSKRQAHEREVKAASATTSDGQAIKESNVIVNYSEAVLAKEIEDLGIILGNLDAKLSIFNATTTIEV